MNEEVDVGVVVDSRPRKLLQTTVSDLGGREDVGTEGVAVLILHTQPACTVALTKDDAVVFIDRGILGVRKRAGLGDETANKSTVELIRR